MTHTDVENKRLNPAASYGDPEQVVDDPGLSRDEKIAILREWHYDAMRLQESAGENMTGGEEDRLRAVSNALLKLGISPAREGDPRSPAKSSPLRKAHRYVAKAIESLRNKGGHS
jgi:hypothetical protein